MNLMIAFPEKVIQRLGNDNLLVHYLVTIMDKCELFETKYDIKLLIVFFIKTLEALVNQFHEKIEI